LIRIHNDLQPAERSEKKTHASPPGDDVGYQNPADGPFVSRPVNEIHINLIVRSMKRESSTTDAIFPALSMSLARLTARWPKSRNLITLRGSLPSYYLKQVAQETVSGVEGVRRVVYRIEVHAREARARLRCAALAESTN
jgi:hypothetical protein